MIPKEDRVSRIEGKLEHLIEHIMYVLTQFRPSCFHL